MLGDKNFPEEYVLGSLYQQALEAQGYTVKLKPNLGSTEVAFAALKSGQIQGYPEYDGTLLATVAGITANPASSAAAASETEQVGPEARLCIHQDDPVHGLGRDRRAEVIRPEEPA